MLRFRNFSSNILNCIYTDFCEIDSDKKMFFLSDAYGYTVNRNGLLENLIPPVNIDYDTRNYIKSININDIHYRPITHRVFTKNHTSLKNIYFNENSQAIKVPTSDVRSLGFYKTNHWEYEKETRIICRFGYWDDNPLLDHIDLRLKEKIFEGLEIVLNPWAKESLVNEIHEIINNSHLSENIKNTITVHSSDLNGLIKG